MLISGLRLMLACQTETFSFELLAAFFNWVRILLRQSVWFLESFECCCLQVSFKYCHSLWTHITITCLFWLTPIFSKMIDSQSSLSGSILSYSISSLINTLILHLFWPGKNLIYISYPLKLVSILSSSFEIWLSGWTITPGFSFCIVIVRNSKCLWRWKLPLFSWLMLIYFF